MLCACVCVSLSLFPSHSLFICLSVYLLQSVHFYALFLSFVHRFVCAFFSFFARIGRLFFFSFGIFVVFIQWFVHRIDFHSHKGFLPVVSRNLDRQANKNTHRNRISWPLLYLLLIRIRCWTALMMMGNKRERNEANEINILPLFCTVYRSVKLLSCLLHVKWTWFSDRFWVFPNVFHLISLLSVLCMFYFAQLFIVFVGCVCCERLQFCLSPENENKHQTTTKNQSINCPIYAKDICVTC